MFLDQNLRTIRVAKDKLALCGSLRRQLVHLELHGVWSGLRRTLSPLTFGWALAEHVLAFLRTRGG